MLAREGGKRWFIGGLFSGAAHTAQVPLNLPKGTWLVDVVQDAPNGLEHQPRTVNSGDTVSVDVPNNGGFAAIVCPWLPHLTTCDNR